MLKRVLYISWTSRNERPYFDPSVRYRCFNFANELVRRGHSAAVISQVKFQTIYKSLPHYDAYVFHRPYLTQELSEFLLEHSEDKLLIADFDDLIFDVRHTNMTPMVRVRGGDSKAVRSYLSKTYDAASLFSNFTLSTHPLRDHAEKLFPHGNSMVLHNSIDPGFIGLSRIARQNSPINTRPYALGYFSGTASHDKDFAMIAPFIIERLKKTGEKILLVGPLVVPAELLTLGTQVVVAPLVSFHELAKCMAQCVTVLAPLEDTIFTKSKSGLKFFEAVLAGCDVIATPIPDIDRFESPLLHKCTTVNDWEAAVNAPYVNNLEEREVEIRRIESIIAAKSQVDDWLKTFMSPKNA
jgi:glycosyltransferase involved in cell wall biosynthesis